MPTVSGKWKWKWNDTPLTGWSSGKTFSVKFSIPDTSVQGTSISLNYGSDDNPGIYFDSDYVYAYGDFNTSAYQYIDFGSSPQEVSQDFYNYLTANATKQEEPVVLTTTKTVSSNNLARFKQKCDETYAGKDEIPNVPAIPTPRTSDNGKVLGVINGAYSLLNLFPVGVYYITENAMTPASLFGGEWVQVKGKFLLGASVSDGYPLGTEGGEKTHTLTIAEMPQHSHKPHQFTWIVSYRTNTGQNVINGGNKGNANMFNVDGDQNRYTEPAGGNAAHNNMPPYRSVFIWRRTA